ncbi:MAG: hypothetical protein Q9218_002744, partial [Villophora microphyllina]
MAPAQKDPEFHPPRLTAPKRAARPAEALDKVPREIAHNILDNLTVSQVLQLASCQEDSDYLDQCILGHPRYQHLFDPPYTLTDIQDFFIVYHGLRTSLNLVLAPSSSPLGHSIGIFSSNGIRIVQNYLPHYLAKKSLQMLTLHGRYPWTYLDIYPRTLVDTLGRPLIGELEQSKPHTAQQCQAIFERWQRTVEAQQMINDMRAAQLRRMAEIYKTYPDLVKGFDDPSQKPRRNVQHTASLLRNLARKVGREQGMIGIRKRKYFGYHLFPLVPFDSCLRLSIRVVNQNPRFPPKIARDVKTVIKGMP